jgi:hypothetical protein
MLAGSMSSPATNGGAAREDDPTGLGEPLLTNVDDAGGFHPETLATVVVATTAPNGNAKVMKGSMKAEAKDDDRYWVDVHREVTTAADLESGVAGRSCSEKRRSSQPSCTPTGDLTEYGCVTPLTLDILVTFSFVLTQVTNPDTPHRRHLIHRMAHQAQ